MENKEIVISRYANGWTTKMDGRVLIHNSAESVFHYIAGSLLDSLSAESLIESLLKVNKTSYNLKFDTLKIMEKGDTKNGKKEMEV